MIAPATMDYKKLFESTPSLYLVLNPDLVIVGASDAYLNATMTRIAEIRGRYLFDVFPDNPDDPGATGESNLLASLKTVLQQRKPHAMAVQKYDIRRPDGVFEERFWSPLNKPILSDDNELEYIIHRVEDVTEFMQLKSQQLKQAALAAGMQQKLNEMEIEIYKRAQDLQLMNEQLQRSEQMFSTVFYKSPVMNSIADLNTGRYIEVNENFASFAGFSRAEMIGKNALDLQLAVSTRDRATLLRVIKERGFAKDVLSEVRTKDGTIKWVSVSAHAVQVNGQECFLTAMVDVTERRKIDELVVQQNSKLEQVNKEMETFSYSVSHDLRAPLRIIDGYTEIAVTDYGSKLDDEGRRILNVISVNVRRMGQLIDDLLNLSRYGRKELQIQHANMNDVVTAVLKDLSGSITGKYRFMVADLLPAAIDRNLLYQVWINLISNAIKYSAPNEAPVIEIDSYTEDQQLVYKIKDNGVGFNMKYADKLFGVFQRLHKITEFEGTGVGLALVQQIVARHGGRVWAAAEKDKGATFYFSIPMATSKQENNTSIYEHK